MNWRLVGKGEVPVDVGAAVCGEGLKLEGKRICVNFSCCLESGDLGNTRWEDKMTKIGSQNLRESQKPRSEMEASTR